MNPSALGVTLFIALLGSSCATDRMAPSAHAVKGSSAPPVEELERFVLVLQAHPGGLVTHDWRPAESVDLSPYRRHSRPQAEESDIERVVARPRDCDEENLTCFTNCMRTPLQRGFGHITSGGRGKGGKREYCDDHCRQSYLDCTQAQGRNVQEFSSIGSAIAGLKSHLPLVVAGSIVIIAGTLFVTVSAGTGLIILVPAAALIAS